MGWLRSLSDELLLVEGEPVIVFLGLSEDDEDSVVLDLDLGSLRIEVVGSAHHGEEIVLSV